MPRNDTTMTLHDTTKSCCVMAQTPATTALADVLTQMTQIHPRVPTRVRGRAHAHAELSGEASGCVMCHGRRRRGRPGKVHASFGDGSFPAMNRPRRPREQPPIQTDFLSVVRSGPGADRPARLARVAAGPGSSVPTTHWPCRHTGERRPTWAKWPSTSALVATVGPGFPPARRLLP